MFMGVNSCTGPIGYEELQAIMLVDGSWELTVNSNIFSPLQDGIPRDTHTRKNTKI